MVVPKMDGFLRGNPIKMDDFRGTPISGNLNMKIIMDDPILSNSHLYHWENIFKKMGTRQQ